MLLPMQKIFFGPPGCGKSFRVREDAKKLGLTKNSPNMIETTFHPEYGYGDFVAKLLPQTVNGEIKYNIHAGSLIKALARAYADLEQPVLLVIDEINRGNCAQIFGDIFQLLDRNDDGWSEYGVNPSDLIMDALKQEMGGVKITHEVARKKLAIDKDEKVCKLHLPPNLSLIGTMNTSDESVYYMDTAFKRRWDFEFMSWQGESVPEWQRDAKINIGDIEHTWHDFLERLNDFIAHKFKERSVDDKQVGIWFLKGQNATLTALNRLKSEKKFSVWKQYFPIVKLFHQSKDSLEVDSMKATFKELGYTWPELENKEPENLAEALIAQIKYSQVDLLAIRNKLMFFLWDNVFSRSRLPLCELLGKEVKTFGDFSSKENSTIFIEKVMAWPLATKPK